MQQEFYRPISEPSSPSEMNKEELNSRLFFYYLKSDEELLNL